MQLDEQIQQKVEKLQILLKKTKMKKINFILATTLMFYKNYTQKMESLLI